MIHLRIRGMNAIVVAVFALFWRLSPHAHSPWESFPA